MMRRDPEASRHRAARQGPPHPDRRGAAWLALLFALGLAWTAPGSATASSSTISPVRFVTPNGVTVLVLEQPALPIVQIHALITAGSARDPAEKAGLANLTALMLDEGTATRTATKIAEAIDFVGGSLSTGTTEDFTTASVKVLSKDRALGFELLADILLHPTFPAEELARVRSQVLGEIKSEQEDPETVAMKEFHRLVFGRHPYAWPPNGTLDTVPAITRADLASFYAREYRPAALVVAVVGDITVKEVRGFLAGHFGSWAARPAAPRRVPPPDPVRTPTVRLIDRDLSQSTIVLGHLGISRSNPDYYAVSVMNYILGAGGFSSRLMDSIRDRQGLAYGVGSVFEANVMPGAFLVSLQTRNEAANQAIDAVRQELAAMREREVTEQELADTKAYLIGSFPLRLDTVTEIARVLALVEFYGLGLDYFTAYPTWIEQVTREDVLRVARQYLDPSRYVLVVVGNVEQAAIRMEGAHRRMSVDE